MILLLIALVSLTASGFLLASIAKDDQDLIVFIGVMSSVIGAVGLALYSLLAFYYFAAEYKADIINREYNTNYTRLEVFYASDVIDAVQELNRNRIEINGDLMRDK